jgi:hypothetical protein
VCGELHDLLVYSLACRLCMCLMLTTFDWGLLGAGVGLGMAQHRRGHFDVVVGVVGCVVGCGWVWLWLGVWLVVVGGVVGVCACVCVCQCVCACAM